METINEALKLIASALEILKNQENLDQERYVRSILLLEEAVDKLAV